LYGFQKGRTKLRGGEQQILSILVHLEHRIIKLLTVKSILSVNWRTKWPESRHLRMDSQKDSIMALEAVLQTKTVDYNALANELSVFRIVSGVIYVDV